MVKCVLLFVVALLFSTRFACSANITSDASLTLGNPTTATSVGNRANDPWVMSKCSSEPLWQLVPDAWAVNSSAKGSITMQYSGSGSVVTTVNLSGLQSSGVNGFPFVFYGADPYGNHISGQPLKFPVQLNSMSSMFVDVNYALSIPGKAPGDLDVAFDEWIVPSATYTGGPSAALEVLVAPYFNFAWAPAGHFVETLTKPVTINGKVTNVVFNAYATGTGAGNEIIFFPRDVQIPSGDVRLDLLDFMNTGAAIAEIDSSWFLAGIEFGSEFGNTTVANYTFTTNKIEIDQDFGRSRSKPIAK